MVLSYILIKTTCTLFGRHASDIKWAAATYFIRWLCDHAILLLYKQITKWTSALHTRPSDTLLQHIDNIITYKVIRHLNISNIIIFFRGYFVNVWKATNTNAKLFTCVNDKRTDNCRTAHNAWAHVIWNCSVNCIFYIVEAIDHDRLQTKLYTIESDRIRSIHFDNFDHEITTTKQRMCAALAFAHFAQFPIKCPFSHLTFMCNCAYNRAAIARCIAGDCNSFMFVILVIQFNVQFANGCRIPSKNAKPKLRCEQNRNYCYRTIRLFVCVSS